MRIFWMGATRWVSLGNWLPHRVTCRPVCRREGVLESEAVSHNKALAFDLPAEAAPPDSLPTTPNIGSPACARVSIQHAHRLGARHG